MLKKGKKIDLPFRLEDGRRIFTMDCVLDMQRRPETSPNSETNQQEITPPEEGEGSGDASGVLIQNAAAQQGSEDGLVRRQWRLISCVQAWPTTALGIPLLVDYGHENGKIIRQAIPFINNNRPDFTKDHSRSIKDVIGHVENAHWEDSKDIPPGINADVVIDPEIEPTEAKRLEKGTFRSGSIGIRTEWSKSHEDMDDWDFFQKQGKKVKGEIVRVIPIKFISIEHMATVPAGAGADKNAGVRNVELHNADQQHTGGSSQMEKWFELLNKLLARLKINDSVDASMPEPPDGLEATAIERIDALNSGYAGRASLVKNLETLATAGGLVKADEAGITLEQILERLPDALKRAKNGDLFLDQKRKEALTVFDAARVDPTKAELSDVEKKMRARIENSCDAEFIEEQLLVYTDLKNARFTGRSSGREELPNVDGAGKAEINPDIADSVRRTFKRNAKDGGAK